MMTKLTPAILLEKKRRLTATTLEANIIDNPDDIYLLLLHKLENPKKEFYFLCVEGVDDKSFYSSYFNRSYITKDRELIGCGGRAKVEQLLNLLKKESGFETRFRSVLFFVDRDLSPPPSHERLFVTCGYSIENYLCNVKTVYQVLQLYHLDPSPTFTEIEEKYKKQLELFRNEYFRIMAFVKENPSHAWVDEYRPERCFHQDWQRKSNAESDLKKIDEADLDIEEYSTDHIRGKYVLTFLTWLIQSYPLPEKKSDDWIFERLISHVQSIPALDDYFQRHIKEAS